MWSTDLNAPAALLPSLLLVAFVMCVAFSVGYAVRRMGICGYAAARQSVLYRRHSRLLAFFLVACWAGAILLPAAWLVPQAVHLSPVYPVTPAVLLGGAVFGLGILVNGGCAFGTLTYLSGGDTNYLGTVAGAFAGALTALLLGAHRADERFAAIGAWPRARSHLPDVRCRRGLCLPAKSGAPPP